MGWVRIEDSMPEHPKIIGAGPRAAWLFVCSIAYSNRVGTDGFVPKDAVARLAGGLGNAKKETSALLDVGLWDAVDGGYRVHDFLDWQRSAIERSAAARKAANARWHSDADAPRNAGRNAGGNAKSDAEKSKRREEDVEANASTTSPSRLDVERICSLFADLVEGNVGKRPPVTSGWRDAARLLIDRDGHVPDEIERVMRWATADEFWRANVLGLPKFRQQFDRLRLSMERTRIGPANGGGADARVAELLRQSAAWAQDDGE